MILELLNCQQVKALEWYGYYSRPLHIALFFTSPVLHFRKSRTSMLTSKCGGKWFEAKFFNRDIGKLFFYTRFPFHCHFLHRTTYVLLLSQVAHHVAWGICWVGGCGSFGKRKTKQRSCWVIFRIRVAFLLFFLGCLWNFFPPLKNRGNEGPALRIRQLEEQGKEDDMDLVEKATYRDRAWDDWKGDNVKGRGNTKKY